MKNIAIALLMLVLLSFAGTVQAQIPNPGFESWTGTTTLIPDGWTTNNIPPLAVPVTRTSTSHSGSYAIQGSIVSYANLVSWPVILEAMFPYVGRPASLTGYYTFTSIQRDSLVGVVYLYKHNLGLLVAGGTFGTATNAGTFTKFAIPLEYFSPETADSAFVEFIIADGNNDSLHVGSTFILDDLAFEGTATSVKEQASAPQSFALRQNYPNPFNPGTEIQFDLPQAQQVHLAVFNVLGQQVAMLLNEQMPAGTHHVRFDASALPSGTYFYRLEAGQFVDVKRMTLVK